MPELPEYPTRDFFHPDLCPRLRAAFVLPPSFYFLSHFVGFQKSRIIFHFTTQIGTTAIHAALNCHFVKTIRPPLHCIKGTIQLFVTIVLGCSQIIEDFAFHSSKKRHGAVQKNFHLPRDTIEINWTG